MFSSLLFFIFIIFFLFVNFAYFAELKKSLSESEILKLKEEIDDRPFEGDKGVKFTAKFVTAPTTT